ncbi:MAG: transposase [Chitinophagaceae bacterium]|nr:transposase [Chitinophagaceae bacterium]
MIQCTLHLPFLDEENCLEVVRTAIAQLDSPDIINSDQGSQLTCRQYVGYFKGNGITISMDGKGRALDNIYIERSWRSIKYQHIHLFPAEDGISLYLGIREWLNKYHLKSHQGIGRNKPSELHLNAA